MGMRYFEHPAQTLGRGRHFDRTIDLLGDHALDDDVAEALARRPGPRHDIELATRRQRLAEIDSGRHQEPSGRVGNAEPGARNALSAQTRGAPTPGPLSSRRCSRCRMFLVAARATTDRKRAEQLIVYSEKLHARRATATADPRPTGSPAHTTSRSPIPLSKGTGPRLVIKPSSQDARVTGVQCRGAIRYTRGAMRALAGDGRAGPKVSPQTPCSIAAGRASRSNVSPSKSHPVADRARRGKCRPSSAIRHAA